MNRIVKIMLAGVAVAAALGVGAAFADRAGMANWSFARGPGGHFQRFCATDVSYISGRIAARLTERLKLTDPQKASLKDLQDTFIKAAAEAKTLCAETADMSTVVGRLAFGEKRTEAVLDLMKAVQPKLESFYASLDDSQKATFNQMGPGAPSMHHRRDRGDGDSPEHG